MTIRVRVRSRPSARPKLVKAVADALARALGVTENRVRVYAKQGMPHWEGVEACRSWLRTRPSRTRSLLMQQPAAPSAPDTPDTPVGDVLPDASPPTDAGPDDLGALLKELPDELKQMPPRDAYEWLRVLKLQRQLRTEAADRISRAQALDMLVERARVLRQTMMAIPRRMRHLQSDEAAASLTGEIRAALNVYAAPEGYLDRLLPDAAEASGE